MTAGVALVAALALALDVTVLAGCAVPPGHGLPEEPTAAADYMSEGWFKTERGYAWCLTAAVHGGASIDCDWATITDVEPEKYTDITRQLPRS